MKEVIDITSMDLSNPNLVEIAFREKGVWNWGYSRFAAVAGELSLRPVAQTEDNSGDIIVLYLHERILKKLEGNFEICYMTQRLFIRFEKEQDALKLRLSI